MQIKAKTKYLRQSPRKVRLVASAVRGLDTITAQEKLRFINKRAGLTMLKLLNSAIANAKNNFELKEDNLFIKEIKVNEGSTLKRWMPRAFGRASAMNKRTSHIDLVLEEKVPTEKKERKDKKEDYKMDTKIVKSLDEIKYTENTKTQKYKSEASENIEQAEESKPEVIDQSRMGKDRNKQNIDSARKKEKKGWRDKVFQRKSG